MKSMSRGVWLKVQRLVGRSEVLNPIFFVLVNDFVIGLEILKHISGYGHREWKLNGVIQK